jgi:hypothetical protein
VFSHFVFFFSLSCLALFSMTVENKPLKLHHEAVWSVSETSFSLLKTNEKTGYGFEPV